MRFLFCASLLAGCAPAVDDDDDEAVGAEGQSLVSDATHNGGTKGFHFLMPSVSPSRSFGGQFEARLTPEVRIERLDAKGSSVETVAVYTSSKRFLDDQVRRNALLGYYILRWRTSRFKLDPKFHYRASVFTGGKKLGFVDIDVAANSTELKKVDTKNYVPLLNGVTLPIYFRIEKSAVDIDGDGVFDWLDNCPSIKNPPVRVTTDVPARGGSRPSSCKWEENECDPNESACVAAVFEQPDANRNGIGDACECKPGYEGGGLTACTDINECAKVIHACDPLTTCSNTPGSYTCGACPTGYTGNGKTGCLDINECTNGSAKCFPGVTCGNTGGSYQCGTCPPGYTGDGKTCTDVDECAVGNAGCAAGTKCTNTKGSFTCDQCPPGYTSDGKTCSDINECAAAASPCDYRTSCSNTLGGFTCGSCPGGYTGTGKDGCLDVDECAARTAGCSVMSSCVNTEGSFACEPCPPGYQGDGYTCSDINECADGNNGGCSPLVVCTNTLGDRVCGACPSGYIADGYQCIDEDECVATAPACAGNAKCTNVAGGFLCSECPKGYRGDGRTCSNINECAAGTDDCSRTPEVVCSDNEGSWSCGACPGGYHGDGRTCTDDDECALGTSQCTNLQGCVNTTGGYRCDACPAGFASDGVTCRDIDECQRADACDSHTTCTNKDGGYDCSDCPDGMRGDGKRCEDVDECAERLDDCSTDPEIACINLSIELGRFDCGACPAGFVKNGHQCDDLNECATNNGGCDPLVECKNTRGSHTCDKCPDGYNGNGLVCTDIDECAEGPCDKLTTCTNVGGGFQCSACPAGYEGTGKTGCVEIDECTRGTHECSRSPEVTCTNTAGSYTCGACPAYYTSTDGGKTCKSTNPCITDGVGCPSVPLIAMSYEATCVYAPERGMACAGKHHYPSYGSATTAQPAAGPSLTGVSQLVSGRAQFMALLGDGTVRSWGENYGGMLGNGEANDPNVFGSVASLSDATSVDAGGGQACATRPDGSVLCWGLLDTTQPPVFGGAVPVRSSTPVLIPGLANVTQVSIGNSHQCVLHAGRTVSCWGVHAYGQLGRTPISSQRLPVAAVPNLTGVLALSTGDYGDHTCALLEDRTVKCWGKNGQGQLGNGRRVDSPTPQAVLGVANVEQIAVGDDSACALTSARRVICWGANSSGQRGDGTTTDKTAATYVDLPPVASIVAGTYSYCAAIVDGSVRCWGNNRSYQLGFLGPGIQRLPAVFPF